MTHQTYLKRGTAEVDAFMKGLMENSKAEGSVSLDSAAACDFISNATNQAGSVKVPENLQVVLDEAGERSSSVVKALLDGVESYKAAHGMDAPADVVELAIHNAYATTDVARHKYSLDSADSNHSDPRSLQPNRAVVAILTTIAEAIPFAHYLPADIGSNEAKLAIMTHRTGSTHGAYVQNGLLDGIYAGDPYLTTSRVHTVNPTGEGKIEGKLSLGQTDRDHCDQSAEGAKLLRGRAIVYVNGLIAAREVPSGGTGNAPVSGTISVAGTDYAISGTINTDSGEFSLSTTPAMPQTANVVVESFLDLERVPSLTPSVIANVETFPLFANPWRAKTYQTIDTRTQMSNELGLDPYSESVIAIQNQFALERHYDVLAKGKRIAMNNLETFDYAAARVHMDSTRADVWRDLSYTLGLVDQRMAEETFDHGITHLYVGKRVAAQLRGLPQSMFQSSGITARPSIYRVGRLFGQFEVYYSPKLIAETEDAAQILCVGRGSSVARNPVVLGDAVAPSVMPLALNDDLRQGAGYYARNFTCVNPHEPSARGFAMITVTNMK